MHVQNLSHAHTFSCLPVMRCGAQSNLFRRISTFDKHTHTIYIIASRISCFVEFIAKNTLCRVPPNERIKIESITKSFGRRHTRTLSRRADSSTTRYKFDASRQRKTQFETCVTFGLVCVNFHFVDITHSLPRRDSI